jgi:hypothetical protein
MNMLEKQLANLLKGPYASLSLSFNEEHSFDYKMASEYAQYDEENYITWVSQKEKEAAILTNSVWVLQCYPDTPIGSYKIGASSIDAIMKYLAE